MPSERWMTVKVENENIQDYIWEKTFLNNFPFNQYLSIILFSIKYFGIQTSSLNLYLYTAYFPIFK